MARRLVTAVVLALVASACASSSGARNDAAPPPPRLRLPYGVAFDASDRLFVVDGGRHQILRWVARTRRFVVVAGTGVPGTRGDGGPARRARLDEGVSLVFDRAGNLYVCDLAENRIRRIDRRGIITTFARVRAPVGLALDPSGRFLAVASLENWIFRIELATRSVERLAGDGTAATTGDGGRAVDAQVNGPHGVAYDDRGNLVLASTPIRVIDTAGLIRTFAPVSAFQVLPAPDGSLFAVEGNPSGGRVFRLDADGTRSPIAGTGGLTPHRDGVDAKTVGILPSDLAFAPDGSLIVGQGKPVPAIRRIDLTTGVITTYAR